MAGPITTTEPKTITLDGYSYAIDTAQYKHRTRPSLRDGVAINSLPSDSLFDVQGNWMRYQQSWHRGAGQRLRDIIDGDGDPNRSNLLNDVNPWVPGQLTLARGLVEPGARISTTGGRPVFADCGSGSVLFAHLGGSTVYQNSDALVTDFASISGLGGNVTDMTSDGYRAYIATTSNLYTSTGGAASSLSAGTLDRVWFAAGRLFISVGNVLSEVASGGARTTLITHFQSTFTWTCVFAIGSRIYCGGYASRKSELYTFTVDSAGALVRGPEVANLPYGETLTAAASNGGVVVLGTNFGPRLATIGGEGSLTYGPIIDPDEWAVGERWIIDSLIIQGRFAYVANKQTRQLLQINLAEFVDTLLPASCYMGTWGGLGFSGVTVFGLVGTLGAQYQNSILVAENDDYMYVIDGASPIYDTAGTATSGRIHFGTREKKRLTEIELTFAALPADTSVGVSYAIDGGSFGSTTTEATDNATSLTVDLAGVECEFIELKLQLSTSNTANTPTVYSWRVRGYPVVPTVQEWLLPILCKDAVVMGANQGRTVTQSPATLRTRLAALWATKELVTYKEGATSYTVRVEDFEELADSWSTRGDSLQTTFVVRLVST